MKCKLDGTVAQSKLHLPNYKVSYFARHLLQNFCKIFLQFFKTCMSCKFLVSKWFHCKKNKCKLQRGSSNLNLKHRYNANFRLPTIDTPSRHTIYEQNGRFMTTQHGRVITYCQNQNQVSLGKAAVTLYEFKELLRHKSVRSVAQRLQMP